MWEYADCRHLKRTESIDRCPGYRQINRDGGLIQGRCHGPNNIRIVNKLCKPSLCVKCFRREERVIDEETDALIKNLREGIEEYRPRLQAPNLATREWAKSVLEHLEDEVIDLNIQRKFRIAQFREAQGVWADG